MRDLEKRIEEKKEALNPFLHQLIIISLKFKDSGIYRKDGYDIIDFTQLGLDSKNLIDDIKNMLGLGFVEFEERQKNHEEMIPYKKNVRKLFKKYGVKEFYLNEEAKKLGNDNSFDCWITAYGCMHVRSGYIDKNGKVSSVEHKRYGKTSKIRVKLINEFLSVLENKLKGNTGIKGKITT